MTRAAQERPVCSRDIELPLVETFGLVAGMDEVGRGAIAGPVCVGVCVVGPQTGQPPAGLTDSKLLTARRREALVEPVTRWTLASAVGGASAAEIDQIGIVAALRLAGQRALYAVNAQGYAPSFVLLDGSHNWLSEPEVDLFSFDPDAVGQSSVPASAQGAEVVGVGDSPAPSTGAGKVAVSGSGANGVAAAAEHGIFGPGSAALTYDGPVRTLVKGDARVSVIAAASVLAKVRRDSYMAGLTDPGFGWASNKGYGSGVHYDGIREHGLSEQHRHSWNLPGAD